MKLADIRVGECYEVLPEFSSNCGSFQEYGGDEIQIERVDTGWLVYGVVKCGVRVSNCSGCLTPEMLRPSKKTNKGDQMNIKEKYISLFLKEPQKSFRKAGIINGDNQLTDDGEMIFFDWLLQKFGDEFKKDVVDELLKDKKKKD